MNGVDTITWDHGLKEHVPSIQAGFDWAKRELERSHPHAEVRVVTIPVYLMALREWVNYFDTYLFFMLYGESIRERLELSLNNITTLYPILTEYYMMRLFGWQALELQFNTFKEQLKDKLDLNSPQLEERIGVYGAMLA